MKPYQQHDPIADQGKAEPKPKRPTQYTYRGNRYGAPLQFERSSYQAARNENRQFASANAGHGLLTAVMVLASLIRRRR